MTFVVTRLVESLAPCFSCGGTDVRSGFVDQMPVYKVWCGTCRATIYGDMLCGTLSASELNDVRKQELELSALAEWNSQQTLGRTSREIESSLEVLKSVPLVLAAGEAVSRLESAVVDREKFWARQARRCFALMADQVAYLDRNLLTGPRGSVNDPTPQ